MEERIVIRRPDDWHVHLRQDAMLALVLPFTAEVFRRALVMPNVRVLGKAIIPPFIAPPVRTGEDVLWYRQHIRERLPVGLTFEPLMTIAITDQTTPKEIEDAQRQGAIAGKIYPQGITTNPEYGVSDLLAKSFTDVLTEMARVGMVCCVHAEKPGSFSLDAEEDFLPILYMIRRRVPQLKIVVEHVTSAAMVHWIEFQPLEFVAATITVHHLLLEHDDVVGRFAHVHHHCLPTPKRPFDRDAIRRVVLDGDSHFFFGSDSVPHARKMKECPKASAGIFSAPVALQLLADFLDSKNALGRLQPFTSEFGAQFYGVGLNDGQITLVKCPWEIPESIPRMTNVWKLSVCPFFAQRSVNWWIEN